MRGFGSDSGLARNQRSTISNNRNHNYAVIRLRRARNRNRPGNPQLF